MKSISDHERPAAAQSPLSLNRQVICVLGMHRCGTSLLTRMLNLMGVYLGPEEFLMEPNFANPKGYWEHDGVVAINDEILRWFGGAWDDPPIFSAGWENSAAIDDIKQRALDLIQGSFAETELWGWKDPRSCLTLPFWQQLLPNLKYIICLRSPNDVARSLEERDGIPIEKSSDLWLTYVSSALRHSDGKPRLVVFYEDLMDDCFGELQCLGEFLGKPERAKRVDVRNGVQDFIEKALQHHRSSIVRATSSPKITFGARALYIAQRISVTFGRKEITGQQVSDHSIEKALEILSQYSFKASGMANPLVEQLAELESELSDSRNNIRALQRRGVEQEKAMEAISARFTETEQALRLFSTQLAEKDSALQMLSTQLAEKDRALQMLSTQLAKKDSTLQMLSTQLAEKDSALQMLSTQLAEKDSALQMLSTQLAEKDRAILGRSAQ